MRQSLQTLLLKSKRPRASHDFTLGSLPSWLTVSRASNGWYFDSTGTLQQASSNVARFDYDPSTLAAKGLLLEGARTNSIRNNTMVGAAAGSPGALPTNWNQLSLDASITRTIVGTGTQNGISYIDIRFAGTPAGTGGGAFFFEIAGPVAASSGQVWVSSCYLAVVAGSLTNVSQLRIRQDFRDGSSATVGTPVEPTLSPTGTMARFNTGTATAGATTASVTSGFRFATTAGAAIDFTLRIGLPQLELLSSSSQTASSPILTSGSALTRSADIATIGGVPAQILASAQGTALVETTQYIASSASFGRIIGSTSFNPMFQNNSGSFGDQNSVSSITTSGSNPPWTSGARAALAWSASGRSITATSATLATDANGTPMGFGASFYLGSGNGSTTADGWYSKAAFYANRLSDTTLAQKVILGNPL